MAENTDINQNPMDVDEQSNHNEHYQPNPDHDQDSHRQRTNSVTNLPSSSSRSSPTAGMRRARVDDDEDSESSSRDRNRPRTDPSLTTPTTSIPHRVQQQRTTMQFVLSLPQLQQPLAQFSIILDAPSTPNNEPEQGQPQVHEHQFTFDTGPFNRERFASALSNLATRFGAGIMVMSNEREPDLKRAETILKALEVIPRGLMQRMNTVGGVLGGSDSQATSEEQMVCPVCWEPLLEEGAFGGEDQSEDNTQESGSSSNEDRGDAEIIKKSILALPCRHIFHGSCLLPWMSRQTTCPSCRFNLDPEHLTSKPPSFTHIPAHLHPFLARTNAGDQTSEINPQQHPEVDHQMSPNQDGNSMSNTADNTTEGTATLPGTAMMGAMSMVFAAEPPLTESNQESDSQAIPGLDSISEPRATEQNGGANAFPRPNDFPPSFPPELRAILNAIFGDNLTPVPNGSTTNQEVNQGGSQDPAAVISPEANQAASTEASHSALAEHLNTVEAQRPSTSTAIANSQYQSTGEPAGTATDFSTVNRGRSSSGGGLMTELLGALLGGVPSRMSTAPLPSAPMSGAQASASSTIIPSVVVNPTPNPTPTRHTIPSWATTSMPSVNTLPQPQPPFHSHFLSFSNGHAQMPSIPQNAGGIPRPFVIPPFPPNLAVGNLEPLPQSGHPLPDLNFGTTQSAQPHGLNPHPPRVFEMPFTNIGPSIPMFPFPGMPSQPRERKRWNLPKGQGASVRQRVEEKERQMGLRCYDPSCGFAPTDDSPATLGEQKRRLFMHKEGKLHEHACEHAFHSGCLVSAARVAGFGPEGTAEGDVEVPCTVCRNHGYVEKEAWEEGVHQLQINEA